jgi:hypothetical protein
LAVRTIALQQLSELQPAPSVELHDTPRESIDEHLGLTRSGREEVDDLDRELARKFDQYLFHECSNIAITKVIPVLHMSCRSVMHWKSQQMIPHHQAKATQVMLTLVEDVLKTQNAGGNE